MGTKKHTPLILEILHNKKYFFVFLLAGGLTLTFIGLFVLFYQKAILSFSQTPEKIITTISREPAAKRIVVDDLKIDLPIEESSITNGIWEISEKGASHLNISANPGENGNIVVYGHNKKVIFGSLPYIRIGAVIKIITSEDKTHEYKVINKTTIKPDDINYVLPKEEEILTIYTCNGFLDTTRFIVQAKPI